MALLRTLGTGSVPGNGAPIRGPGIDLSSVAQWNRVVVRFTLFSLSTVALLMLAARAAMAVF